MSMPSEENNENMRQAKVLTWRKVRAPQRIGCQLRAGGRKSEESATEKYRHVSGKGAKVR